MASTTSSRPAARATRRLASMVSVQALADTGRTMPVVPRMDNPPTTPSRRFSVFSASASPSRTKIRTSTRPLLVPPSTRASATAARIIRRGTGLMAGSPTATGNPGLVTTPTPGPLTSTTDSHPGSSSQRASAPISAPLVTSGSSPASLTTVAKPVPKRQSSNEWREPSGKGISTRPGCGWPSRPSTAALAAAAAQAPVV